MPDSASVSDNLLTVAQLYPWHKPLWQQLSANRKTLDHFPHALLFSGMAGSGKKALAFYLAQTLMCHSPVEDTQAGTMHPCQQCRSCQLFNSGNHPDLYYLTTAEDKKIIPVENVRDLIQWSVLSSQLVHKKVVIIEPADAMNQNAANSLLKTLEEPAANTILILVSNKKQALLPTIRSRCQAIDMALPEPLAARQWLQKQGIETAQLMLVLAAGSPLKALEVAQEDAQTIRKMVLDKVLQIASDTLDPVSAAEQLFKLTGTKTATKSRANKSRTNKSRAVKNKLTANALDIIYWLDSVWADVARLSQLKVSTECEQFIINQDYQQDLQQLSNRLYLKKLLQLTDLVNKAYYEIQGSVNLNLLFEKLLIDWKNCLK